MRARFIGYLFGTGASGAIRWAERRAINVALVGQTLTVQVGSGPTQTITFGTGSGQVATLAQLQTEIGALHYLNNPDLNVNNGVITLTAASSTDSITIGGTVALSKFGLKAGVTDPPTASSSAPLERG